MIWLWSGLAALFAVSMEALFIRFTYSTLLPWIIVPAVGINYCIYRIVQLSDNLIEALAAFALANVFLRMGVSAAMHQVVTRATWLTASLILLANLVKAIL